MALSNLSESAIGVTVVDIVGRAFSIASLLEKATLGLWARKQREKRREKNKNIICLRLVCPTVCACY